MKLKLKKINKKNILLIPFALVFAGTGVFLLFKVLGASPNASLEPENGNISYPASKITDSTASNGAAINFNKAVTSTGYCPLDKVGIPPNCLSMATKNSSGEFIIKCTWDHTAPDDPIVKPNQPGASHSHDFYGLQGVTSDPMTLIGTKTTCENIGDTAAYWHPTLMVNGVAVKPILLRAYYQGTNQTHTFPPGFQATAGNPYATSPQSDTIVYWGCGSGSSHPKQSTIPQCASGEGLAIHIKMNDCWSGKILPPFTDYTSELGSDGQSKGDGTCPAAFPYHIPAVILDATWNIAPDPALTTLSCGSPYCGHGDFNFGWQAAAFEADMSRCLRAATNCGSVTN